MSKYRQTLGFELQYRGLVQRVLEEGKITETRNGYTKSLFHTSLSFNLSSGFPLITGRKMHIKGILGEYAAFIRGPKTLEDFKMWGCNYWDTWADKNEKINVDYGTKWRDFNGFPQLDWLLNEIKTNPTSRRLLLSGWDPANLSNLSLPCCHYMYQFYVNDDGCLDMIWHQRSADVMIGIPSDMVLAAVMLLSIAGATNLKPGTITMVFGDTHIYSEHTTGAFAYLERSVHLPPEYKFEVRDHPTKFLPSDLEIILYKHEDSIKFELKA